MQIAAIAMPPPAPSASDDGETCRVKPVVPTASSHHVRKPYIIYHVVLGNQILPSEIPQIRGRGYLQAGTWTRALVAAEYPQVMVNGAADSTKLSTLPEADQVRLGRVIFMYQCGNCHAERSGYSALSQLITGWDARAIRDTIPRLGDVNFFMPPWMGTPEEADLLARYLQTIARPRPQNLLPATAP